MRFRRAAAVSAVVAVAACGIDVVGSDPADVTALADGGPDGRIPPRDANDQPDTRPSKEVDGSTVVDADVPDADSGVDAQVVDLDAGHLDDGGIPPVTTDSNNCPKGRGPDMVRFGGFCIDSHEVNTIEYGVFLSVADAGSEPPVPGCEAKTSNVPDLWVQQQGTNLPVVRVDVCDAERYCRWAGKALCADEMGKPPKAGELNNPAKNPWFAACTTGALPVDAGDCNTGQGVLSLSEVEHPKCEGSFAGLHDIVGNAREITICTGATCMARGSSFRTPTPEAGCLDIFALQKTTRADDVGIRCCAYPP